MIKKFLKWTKRMLLLLFLGIACMLLTHGAIYLRAKGKLYTDASAIPFNKVGLLLGTGKYLANGNVNLYYKYRLQAVKALYQQKKIEFILVSGDNSRESYNEPQEFKDDLMAIGVPEDKIFLDYAGFRTLDSVVRAKKIFGLQGFTIISQKFHNERALYIARSKGIDAIGFNARDVSRRYGLKIKIRENFARVKMMLDLYLLSKQPKFLGEKIEIK